MTTLVKWWLKNMKLNQHTLKEACKTIDTFYGFFVYAVSNIDFHIMDKYSCIDIATPFPHKNDEFFVIQTTEEQVLLGLNVVDMRCLHHYFHSIERYL